ncbi:hypothetical protein ACHAXT_002689 [Thalassiosira profunda]
MVLGVATGKGLDVKGKSAKRGNISSFVPFVQIYEEAHKEECKADVLGGENTVRIFYGSEEGRDEAHEAMLSVLLQSRMKRLDYFHVVVSQRASGSAEETVLELVDTYADSPTSPVFGIDVSEWLFWESYVVNQDCSRPADTEWDIGRSSEPAFMEMNFDAIRRKPSLGEPRAVVYQMSESNPLEPRMLLVAYEENGGVKPVVSDFDCFLLGSRGVKYREQIPPEQVELVQWSVKMIGAILDERARSMSKASWMEAWIDMTRKKGDGYHPSTPKYGNGDPKSYEIIEVAVSRLQDSGCVRHGAECFNWFFPQDIDEEFLVISDTLPGNIKWKRVGVQELQELLIAKIDEGFTFPINPKWVLCDPGWRRVYDKLLSSAHCQDSLNCWLPPETGLREEIDALSARHPKGFKSVGQWSQSRRTVMLAMRDWESYYGGMKNREMCGDMWSSRHTK